MLTRDAASAARRADVPAPVLRSHLTSSFRSQLHIRSIKTVRKHTLAGTHSAVVYNALGEEMDSLELPDPPAAPLQMVDFSGDGLTDILLVTQRKVYGFQLVRHMSASAPFATMLAGLLIAVVVVYVTQQGPTVQHRVRSTDRVD